MSNNRPATSDVTLADEKSHWDELPQEHLAEHFMDYIDIMVMGKAEGNDIWLVAGIYHQRARSLLNRLSTGPTR